MWMLFEHKVAGMCLPRIKDESYFQFFSIIRIRLIAILHTCFLLGSLFFFYWYLW